MRGFYTLIFSFLAGSVFGQLEGDTLGLTGGMGDTVVANRLFGEMKGLMKERKWEEADIKGERALSIYSKTVGAKSRQVADVWSQKGRIGYSRGNYDSAAEYYEKSLNIRIEVLGEEHLDVASTYNSMGSVYYKIRNYEKTKEFYQKSYDIRLKLLGEDNLDVAYSYNNLGIAFHATGEFDKSITHYQKALKTVIKSLGTNNTVVANIYNFLGASYESKGEIDRAIENYQLALNTQSGSPNLNNVGPYNGLGTCFSKKGDFNKAIKYYQKALDIFLQEMGEEHPDLKIFYNNIGTMYASMNDYDVAIKYFKKALNVSLKNYSDDNPSLIEGYENMGIVYKNCNNYTAALEYEKKSLDIKIKTFGMAHPFIATSYNNLGSTYFSMGEYEKATEYYQKALDIRLKIFGILNPEVALTYTNLGDVRLSQKEFDKAIFFYDNALHSCNYDDQKFSDVNSIEELLRSLNSRIKTLQMQLCKEYDKGQGAKNYEYVLKAIEAIDYQQRTFSEENTKFIWQTKNYPIYEQAISVSLLKGNIDRDDVLLNNTFSYAEKSKAAILQAQIKSADALTFAGIPDSLLQKEHTLRINITWREKQRQTLLDKGLSETDTNTLRISSIIFNLRRDYETLKKRFETDYPDYYRLKYDLNTVSLQYVQDTLLQPKNQALLEYFVGDSSIYLFVVRPDTMIVQEVKRDFPLEDWIEQLRQGLYGYYTADKGKRTTDLYNSTQKQYIEYAQKLYQKLVAPVQPWLLEQVIVVPDGPLGYVPFDALLTGTPPQDSNDFKSYPYLLNKHQFSYTYSATLLKEMCDKKHHRTPTKKFAAFAPFYTGDTSLLANMYAYDDLMRKDLQPLAYSGSEVAAASKLMNGEIVAGAAATEERFTSTAGDYRILHLATHGRADNRVGDYAFLAFTEIKDSIENELLYVKDLYNLELNADLVVLSACETGIGKLQRGEGIISLARAFAYAGAKSIVTTLWEVNDKSTSELMRYFYRELQRENTKDEALRSARKAYLEKSKARTCHPFFWAAFVPIGDMRAVK